MRMHEAAVMPDSACCGMHGCMGASDADAHAPPVHCLQADAVPKVLPPQPGVVR